MRKIFLIFGSLFLGSFFASSQAWAGMDIPSCDHPTGYGDQIVFNQREDTTLLNMTRDGKVIRDQFLIDAGASRDYTCSNPKGDCICFDKPTTLGFVSSQFGAANVQFVNENNVSVARSQTQNPIHQECYTLSTGKQVCADYQQYALHVDNLHQNEQIKVYAFVHNNATEIFYPDQQPTEFTKYLSHIAKNVSVTLDWSTPSSLVTRIFYQDETGATQTKTTLTPIALNFAAAGNWILKPVAMGTVQQDLTKDIYGTTGAVAVTKGTHTFNLTDPRITTTQSTITFQVGDVPASFGNAQNLYFLLEVEDGDQPAFTVTKEIISTGPYGPGKEIKYKITVTNTGTVPLYDFDILDTLGAGLTFKGFESKFEKSAESFSFHITTDSGLIESGEGQILSPGQSAEAIFTATIDAGTSGNQVCNDIVSAFAKYGTNGTYTAPVQAGQNYVQRVCTTVESISLDVQKVAQDMNGNPLPVDHVLTVGEQFRYEIIVKNTGITPLTDVVVQDTLETGLTFVSQGSSPFTAGTLNPKILTGAFGELLPGATKTAWINVQVENVAELGALCNTATGFDRQVRQTGANVSDATSQKICFNTKARNAKFTVKKEIVAPLQPPYVVGDTITYLVTIENTGDVPLTDIDVSDTLDAGLAFAGFTAFSETQPDASTPVSGEKPTGESNGAVDFPFHMYAKTGATPAQGLVPGKKMYAAFSATIMSTAEGIAVCNTLTAATAKDMGVTVNGTITAGGTNSNPVCITPITQPICGNGIVEPQAPYNEQCDEGGVCSDNGQHCTTLDKSHCAAPATALCTPQDTATCTHDCQQATPGNCTLVKTAVPVAGTMVTPGSTIRYTVTVTCDNNKKASEPVAPKVVSGESEDSGVTKKSIDDLGSKPIDISSEPAVTSKNVLIQSLDVVVTGIQKAVQAVGEVFQGVWKATTDFFSSNKVTSFLFQGLKAQVVADIIATDTLDSQLIFAATNNTPGVTYTALTHSVQLNFGPPIGANFTSSLSFDVTVDANVPDGTQICNVANYGTATSPQICHTVQGGNSNCVSLFKTASPAPGTNISRGQTITYSVTATNTCATPAAQDVVATDLLDGKASFLQSNISFTKPNRVPDNWYDQTTNTVSLNFGKLAAGATKTLLFDVTVGDAVPDGTMITNVALIGSTSSNPITHTVLGAIDPGFLIEKSGVSASGKTTCAEAGETITYTIKVTNTGATDLTAIQIEDMLDPQVMLDYTSLPGTSSFDSVRRVVVFQPPFDLKPQESLSLTFSVIVNTDATGFVYNRSEGEAIRDGVVVRNNSNLVIHQIGCGGGSSSGGGGAETIVTAGVCGWQGNPCTRVDIMKFAENIFPLDAADANQGTIVSEAQRQVNATNQALMKKDMKACGSDNKCIAKVIQDYSGYPMCGPATSVNDATPLLGTGNESFFEHANGNDAAQAYYHDTQFSWNGLDLSKILSAQCRYKFKKEEGQLVCAGPDGSLSGAILGTGANLTINKEVSADGAPWAKTLTLAKMGTEKYKVTVSLAAPLVNAQEYKFKPEGARLDIFDVSIPAIGGSGWWERGNFSSPDVSNIAGGFSIELTSDQVEKLNAGSKVEIPIEYTAANGLNPQSDYSEFSNVAWAHVYLPYQQLVQTPSADGTTSSSEWVDQKPLNFMVGPKAMLEDICNADFVGEVSINPWQALAKIDMTDLSSKGSIATTKIVRPFVTASGGASVGMKNPTSGERVFGNPKNIPDVADKFSDNENSQDLTTIDTFFSKIKDADAFFGNLQKNEEPAKISIAGLEGSFTTTPDNAGVYFSTGDVKITGNVPLDKSSTFIIDGNLTISADVLLPNKFAAFVVRGGTITIDPSVKEIHGLFMTDIGLVKGGESKEPLVISGALMGDASELLKNRKYIGKADADGNFQLAPSVEIKYDIRLLQETPPALEDFLGKDWMQQ